MFQSLPGRSARADVPKWFADRFGGRRRRFSFDLLAEVAEATRERQGPPATEEERRPATAVPTVQRHRRLEMMSTSCSPESIEERVLFFLFSNDFVY